MYKWFLVGIFVAFSIIALYLEPKTPPKGDEIHYLLTTHSIVYDHDLAIGNNYENKDYARWINYDLDSHATAGQDGQDYMYHGLGLFPIILAIPYALAGRIGVHLFLIGAFVLLVDQMYKICIENGAGKRLLTITLTIFSFTVPLLNYSFIMFPEMIGALVTLYTLRKRQSLLVGLLPWIHLRFLPIALPLLFTRPKRAAFQSFILIVLYFAFYWFIFGTINPTQTYAQVGINTGTGNIVHNIILALTDSQYGLFFFAPIYLFAFAGLKYLPKKTLLVILAIFVSYTIPVFRYYDWNGGYSPPARYLAPLVPLIIPGAVLYLENHKQLGIRFLFVLLALWSFFAAFVNLFLTNDYGFVYTNGFSEVLNRTWSITHLNVFRFAPMYYPYQTFMTLHIVWFVVALVVVLLLTKIARTKTK
jgi:hypothetical protein